MRELLVAVAELLAYLLGTLILAGAGVFAELNSLTYLADGNHIFGVWLAVMGMLALYGAFTMGTERLLPHLRETFA